MANEKMGWVGAAAIGVGGMVGGGIFAVLGTAVSMAHGATPIAFVVAGVIAVLTAESYARLSAAYPSSGGTVVFVHQAFGHHLTTGATNLFLWVNYLVTIALYAAAFGSYARTFFPSGGVFEEPLFQHALISIGIVVPAALNLLDASLIAKSETVVVVVKLALLVVVALAGATSVDVARLSPSTWPGWGTTIAGGMVIFVAYEGFELIANSGDDVEDPKTNLPRALHVAVLFVLLLYVALAVVTVGSVGEDRILEAKDYALAAAARPALGEAGFVIVSVSALMATLSAINATIYGNARLGYALAQERELPELVQRQTWSRPVAGVLLTTGLALLIANLLDLEAIAILGSAGFLFIFLVVNGAALRLGREVGARRPLAALGCVGCLAALVILLKQTWADNPISVYWLGGIVALCLVLEAALMKQRGPVQVG